VGTAVARDAATYSQMVHPHRRGDGALAVEAIVLERGSPPQAWGRHGGRDGHNHERRFTPTGVGTAAACHPRRRTSTVHPHRRGDGALSHRGIPWRPVHPHRRGDGLSALSSRACYRGSPPQAWGRLEGVTDDELVDRFTPTGVGTAVRTTVN